MIFEISLQILNILLRFIMLISWSILNIQASFGTNELQDLSFT